MTAKNMEDLVSLCKRRGFIFPSNDVYGGMKGLYDFGPMGTELKINLKNAWWKSIVYERDDVEGLDSSILTSPMVLSHSGHEDTFSDPLIDCKTCKARFRADQLEEFSSFEEMLQVMLVEAKADGAFTDFPDKMVAFLDANRIL